MRHIRYPQFCALARAAEIVGERWTLLVVRELLLGPKRFSDLRERLEGVSPSVLAERLERLEHFGLIRRTILDPPAASTVYELTDDGRNLEPVVEELVRWGARYMLPPRRGERLEPEWIYLAMRACARRGRAPACAFDVRMPGRRRDLVLHVAGGPRGTRVSRGSGPAAAAITGDARTMLGLMSGALDPGVALREGRIRVDGDASLVAAFPGLFDVTVKSA
ncbi:MAG: transcriptional regulator [Armatimonadetes bacterium]|nr:transcriptional regulator [Armatimonadota bacterium]